MNFNPEITVATIISIVTMIFVAGGFYFTTRSLFSQVNDIKTDLKMLNKVVMDVALSNQRQDNFENWTRQEIIRVRDDIGDIRHGKGFIKEG